MFDIAPTELLLCAVVALVVIGPKDLPKALRLVGRWVGKARAMARHFRVGMDAMMREAEMAELQKEWAERNARIMRDYPNATFSEADATAPTATPTVTAADPSPANSKPSRPEAPVP